MFMHQDRKSSSMTHNNPFLPLSLKRLKGQPRAMNRARTDSDLLSLVPVGSPRHNLSGHSPTQRGPFKRSEQSNKSPRATCPCSKRIRHCHTCSCRFLLLPVSKRVSPPPPSWLHSSARTLSSGRLSHMLLKATYGSELFEMGSDESLNSEKSMDATGKRRTNRTNRSTQVLMSNGTKMCNKVVINSHLGRQPVGRRPQKEK